MFENLAEVRRRYEEVTQLLTEAAVISDQSRYRKLSKEHTELHPIVSTYDQYCKVERELTDQRQILDDPGEDPELKAMAHQETPALRKRLEDLEEELKALLVPRDELDSSDIVLEIRAGTGGEEAALFAADLYRMYTRYAERQDWHTELLSTSYSGVGGFKEVILGIEGTDVFRRLKFEGGVHRVQRVPQTETQGRIHTSAATVAVLPQAEEIEVEIHPQDLRIDVFRSSGPGGQSVNTTDSAVRITHLPTNIVVQSQDEKSQHKNKAKAMKVLRARLTEKMREEQHDKEAAQRRSMVGTGDRSERIRTYNFPQGRVTDHRIGLTLYRLEQVMQGDLDELINALLEADQTARLQQGETAVRNN
jgi:peptide chain release factor 1